MSISKDPADAWGRITFSFTGSPEDDTPYEAALEFYVTDGSNKQANIVLTGRSTY